MLKLLSSPDGSKVELVVDAATSRRLSSLLCMARPMGAAEGTFRGMTLRVVVLGEPAAGEAAQEPVEAL